MIRSGAEAVIAPIDMSIENTRVLLKNFEIGTTFSEYSNPFGIHINAFYCVC